MFSSVFKFIVFLQEIEEYISKAKEQGYHTMLQLGSKGVTYATNVIVQTAMKVSCVCGLTFFKVSFIEVFWFGLVFTLLAYL